MTGSNVRKRSLRRAAVVAASLLAWCSCAPAQEVPQNSGMDAPLFYQLIIGEMELSAGRAGNAYDVILDAARRHNDPALFQRAVEIALQARAGDQALVAARAWRKAVPDSVDALRFQAQILLALNKPDEVVEPVAAWLAGAPLAERAGLISALPRLLQRVPDRKQALGLLERMVSPYRDLPETRLASQVALGRMTLAAGQPDAALALARLAATEDPAAAGPALLALDLLPGTAAAEAIVTDYLARAGAEAAVRLAYVRALAVSQRYADAIAQLNLVTRDRPELPEPWLTLGALQVELKHSREAESALQRYVQLAGQPTPAAPSTTSAGDDDEADGAGAPATQARDLTQAWLLLAQAAEQRGDVKAAESWLAKVDSPQRALEVQARRGALLARQGQIKQARALIQAVPERTGDDARAKLLAEAQMLREVKHWREAAEVLKTANQRFSNDADLIYEQAMVEEKLERFAEMERLLRKVIDLKPDHPHAHNALGYSLADRNQRLPEARELIAKALSMSPGDPFITDSLAWVEFRLGNRNEALRLLRQAYQARPDTEIGAHLGEVLWVTGQRDEARQIWAQARSRDAANDVLRETLSRLKVGL
ncbi:MAG: tetratricopeptide repeat protein [Ideonella sp.]|nr:tetratricopeptide repeat protein [Ideonella sp.]